MIQCITGVFALMNSSPKPTDRRTDLIEGVAVSTSLLCLAHCLALPFLLLLLPGVFAIFAQSEAFHWAALALVAPSALAAFWLGYRRHRAIVPALFGLVGVGLLTLALLPGTAEGAETWLTVAGSIALVGGHMMNWRLRSCPVPLAVG